jgi:hypothetical protein
MKRLSEELGVEVDPLEFLLRQMADIEKPYDWRIECAKAALPFCRPKLATVQVTGRDGGPVEMTAVDRIRDTPELADQAEQLLMDPRIIDLLPSSVERQPNE